MHIALPMPKQKTLLEQRWPALIAAAVVAAGVFIIPVHYPVQVSEGRIIPEIVHPSEVAQVKWTQKWRELCPVTVTREFLGADGFPKTALPYELKPPAKAGTSPFNGTVVIPALPVGTASYRSKIEPHCWVDALYQRKYYTPEIQVTVVKEPSAGPR